MTFSSRFPILVKDEAWEWFEIFCLGHRIVRYIFFAFYSSLGLNELPINHISKQIRDSKSYPQLLIFLCYKYLGVIFIYQSRKNQQPLKFWKILLILGIQVKIPNLHCHIWYLILLKIHMPNKLIISMVLKNFIFYIILYQNLT